MFLVVQMFFSTEQVSKEDNTEIIKSLFTFIKDQIEKVKKSFNHFKLPLLHFYQLRNLIQVYTQLLNYFLCFQTPLNEKSTSSQMYSASHTQANHTQYSQQIEDDGQETETQYLLRCQKRCNFCGAILHHPQKFTLAVKCH